MKICNKADLNAIVGQLRKRLREAYPLAFGDLKLQTTHQMFARLAGYKTQAALLADLPSDVSLELGKAKEEVARTKAGESEEIRSVATDILIDYLRDFGTENTSASDCALIRIDLLFAKTAAPNPDYLEEPPAKLPAPNWVALLESMTGLKVGSALSATDPTEVDNPFLGRKSEFTKVLSDFTPEFFTLYDHANFEDHENLVAPGCFTRSALVLIRSNASINDDRIIISGAGFQTLRDYFEAEDFEEKGDTCLIAGEVRVQGIPETADDWEAYVDDEEDPKAPDLIEDLFTLPADDWWYELYAAYEKAWPERESELGPEFDMQCWAHEQFKLDRVHYPQLGISLGPYEESSFGYIGKWGGKHILTLDVFERSPHAREISYSVNRGFVWEFIAHIPGVDINFIGQGGPFWFVDEWSFDLEDSVYGWMDGVRQPHTRPALKGLFSETIKHLPKGFEVNLDPSLAFFERYGAEIVASEAVDSVMVDDFLGHDDLTAVLLLGLYRGDELVAEFSYSVIRQLLNTRTDSNCSELVLDEIIKTWCSEQQLVLNWNEHSTIIQRRDIRDLSHFRNDDAFLPTLPSQYLVNSILPVAVEIHAPGPLILAREDIESAMSGFFRFCVSDTDPFDFRCMRLSELSKKIGGDLQLDHVIEVLADNFADPDIKQFHSAGGINLVGGFNMRGADLSERVRSVKNTVRGLCKASSFPEWHALGPEATAAFVEKLKLKPSSGISIFVNFPGMNIS